MTPEISVIMSIYKEQEIGIKRAVDSIICQTFKNLEFIIIIDNPQNLDAIKLIQEYALKDNRIIYIVHQKNKGLSAGLNEGIKISKGRFIARQDTEDASLPDRLQVQYDYLLSNPNVSIVGTALKYLDGDGNEIMIRKYKQVVGKEINRTNPLGHPTLLIRKECFEKYGYYDENVYCEDYDLWINWYLKGLIFHNLQQSYYDYYQDNDYKKRKAKPELKDTIECIERYTDKLQFSFIDYVFLYLQKVVLFLPSSLIVKLFYIYNKISK
jgi:hypothetical protein